MRKFFAIMVAVALVTPFSVGCGDTKKKTETKKETKEIKDAGTDDTKDTKETKETTTETKETKDDNK